MMMYMEQLHEGDSGLCNDEFLPYFPLGDA